MNKIFVFTTGFTIIVLSCVSNGKKDVNLTNQSKDTAYTTLKVHDSAEQSQKIVKLDKGDSLKVALEKDRVLDDYIENIKIFENLFSKRGHLPPNLFEGIIPVNEDEFLHFYMLSAPEEYPESNINLYWAINDAMKKSALEDRGNCLYLYMNLAEFVDGEYAESFFIYIPTIIERHKSKFCDIYSNLSERSRYMLEDFFDESCEEK